MCKRKVHHKSKRGYTLSGAVAQQFKPEPGDGTMSALAVDRCIRCNGTVLEGELASSLRLPWL